MKNKLNQSNNKIKLNFLNEIINISLEKEQNTADILEQVLLINQSIEVIKETYIKALNSLDLENTHFSYSNDRNTTIMVCAKFNKNNYLLDEIEINGFKIFSIDDINKSYEVNIERSTCKTLNIYYSPYIKNLTISSTLKYLYIDNIDNYDNEKKFLFKNVDLKNVKELCLLNFGAAESLIKSFKISKNVEELLISTDWSKGEDKINFDVINYLFPKLKVLHTTNYAKDFSDLNPSIHTLILDENNDILDEFYYLWEKESISKKDIENLKKIYKIPDTVKNLEYYYKKIF